MSVALERSYSYSNNRSIKVSYKVEENSFEKKPNRGEGWKEIQKATSDVVDALNVLGVFAELPITLRYIKCGLNMFDLWNTKSEISYFKANLRELEKIDKVLLDEISDNEVLRSIHGLETDAVDKEDFAKLYRYYFSNYGNMKELSKGIKNKLEELEKKLETVDNQVEIDAINSEIEALKKNKELLKVIAERVLWLQAVDLNTSNKKKCYFKMGTTFMSFLSDIIALVTLPVLKSALLFIKIPEVIGNGLLRLSKILEEKIGKEKIKDEGEEKILITTLGLPALLMGLLKVLDKHIFKKFRDKAENLRKEERNRRIISLLRKRKDIENKIDELIKGKEDLGEQIEALEKAEDKNIREALRLSKQSMEVLNVKAEGYLKLFKIRPSEDEERIESVAKIVVKLAKNLYLEEEKLKSNSKMVNKEALENKLKVDYDRLKAMVIALGIEKDKADEFINNIKDYKKNKLKGIARAGSKDNMDERILKAYRDDKNGFIDELKNAMKSEEEGA